MIKKEIFLKNKNQFLVTGANGFTGKFVCLELIKRKIPFIALVRKGNDVSWLKSKNINYLYGDVNSSYELSKYLKRCKGIINITSLGFGSAPKIIKACEMSNIKRAIFISTTALFTSLKASSKKIRKEAESLIKESNLKWTIIRPTMIYGTPSDRNLIKLIKWVDKFPFIPVFGNGENLLQPVYVKDLAWVIAEILNIEDTYFETFNISGRSYLSFNKLIRLTAEGLKKKILIIHLPLKIFILIFKFLESVGVKLPIKSEQVLRLEEDKDFSYKKAKDIFNYNPIDFSTGIQKEIKLYKSIKKHNLI